MESRIVPKLGVKYYGISAGKFRRYHKSLVLNIIDPTTIIKNGIDFFRFVRGIFEARGVLSHEKPDVLFAKGGYVSLPVGLAAKTLGIPVVIHESDIVMGLANRRLSSLAEKVCVSFPVKNFPEVEAEKLVETGNPLRQDILKGDGPKYLKEVGFDPKLKTILIMGGSQGSKFINESIMEVLPDLLHDYQLIWIVGDRDLSMAEYRLSEIDKKLASRAKLYGFVSSELADIYAASDIYLGRSGSNVIFELAALGIPAIFIPLESSASGHQFENARLLSRSGAAYILHENGLTGRNIIKHIRLVLSREEDLELMASKMKEWGRVESADKIAEIVIEIGRDSIEQSKSD